MKLTKEEKEILKENILDRYDHEEYWDMELIEDFRRDNEVTLKKENTLKCPCGCELMSVSCGDSFSSGDMKILYLKQKEEVKDDSKQINR